MRRADRCAAVLAMCAVGACAAFRAAPLLGRPRQRLSFRARPRLATRLNMGLFDMFADAFKNEDYSRADRRVRGVRHKARPGAV